MVESSTDVLRGTLDLLILQTLAIERSTAGAWVGASSSL